MIRLKGLLRNRNLILLLSIFCGLFFSQGASVTRPFILPLLAVVMTLSTLSVSSEVLRKPGDLLRPAVLGILMNYLVLAGFLLATSTVLIQARDIWNGFVLLAAVPPAVAVIPFTDFLNGNRLYSLLGALGCYLGALGIMPLITLPLLGSGFVDPVKLLIIMVELIFLPLVVSRVLIWTRVSAKLESIKGPVTNWSFFVVSYTIIGLNREVFLGEPGILLPVMIIAFASTFLLGWLVEKTAGIFGFDRREAVSLILLGTLKNYGLAGGLALALFDRQTALPATVSVVFMVVYVIWLGYQQKHREAGTTGN
jgi:BASS family bile acid:Na+ symporter